MEWFAPCTRKVRGKKVFHFKKPCTEYKKKNCVQSSRFWWKRPFILNSVLWDQGVFPLDRPPLPSPPPPHVVECNKAFCSPAVGSLGFIGVALYVLLWESCWDFTYSALHTTFVRGCGERWLLPRMSRKLGAPPLLRAYGLGLLERELEPCVMGDGKVEGGRREVLASGFGKIPFTQASHPAPLPASPVSALLT